MSYQIINNGPSLKIIYAGAEMSVSKRSIQEITVVREDVIKIDTGNKCDSVYIRHSQITVPVVGSITDLIDELNVWITESVCCSGDEVSDTPPMR